MGFLDALRKRSGAVRFSYSFTLHVLSPWPASNKAVSVAWQRGSKKKKRGVTEPHRPKQVQGQLGTAIEFNDVIQISATLYMDGNQAPTPNGPFKKKCLILAVIESSGANGRETNPLGRVVIDLAEFASMQNEVKKEFPLAVNRNIQAAVGIPMLSMTVKCMWKSTGGPASMASSMSSDRTGGTFTTNFNAFIRGNQNEQIPVRLTGEQFDDLRGFDRLNTITESEHDPTTHPYHRNFSKASGHLRTQESDSFMVDDFVLSPEAELKIQDTIDEERKVELSEERLKTHTRQASRSSSRLCADIPSAGSAADFSEKEEIETTGMDRTGAWLSGLAFELDPQNSTASTFEIPPEMEQDSLDRITSHEQRKEDEAEEKASNSTTDLPALDHHSNHDSEGMSSMELFGDGSPDKDVPERPKAPEPFLALTPKAGDPVSPDNDLRKANFERRWKRAAQPTEEKQPRSPSPIRFNPQNRLARNLSPERSASPMSRVSGPRDFHVPNVYLLDELRSAAFLEYSVYLARPGPQKYTARNIHAPARRIARGLNILSSESEDSVSLLQNCLHAIRVMVDACGLDVPGLSFWWGNCFQLRLWIPRIGRQGGTQRSSPEPSEWSLRRLQQLVLKLEKSIFERLQQYLWLKVLIPVVVSGGHDAKPSLYHESGVQIWLRGLSAVYDQFALSNLNKDEALGHLHLLRRKIVGNCCRRMDALLFRELISGATHSESFFDSMRGLQDDLPSTATQTWPKIPPSCLPFKNGALTFGVGMHLKMAVTRWSEWAIEVHMKDPQHTGDPGQSFFPSLKASADLLMMPKELLTDASVRGELFAALSLRSMCILLEKFQPDEFAPDPVNPSVLRSLTARLNDEDEASGISVVLQEPPFEGKGERDSDSDFEVGFDSESEEEMDTIVKAFASSDHTISRFELLKNHWLNHKDKR